MIGRENERNSCAAELVVFFLCLCIWNEISCVVGILIDFGVLYDVIRPREVMYGK